MEVEQHTSVPSKAGESVRSRRHDATSAAGQGRQHGAGWALGLADPLRVRGTSGRESTATKYKSLVSGTGAWNSRSAYGAEICEVESVRAQNREPRRPRCVHSIYRKGVGASYLFHSWFVGAGSRDLYLARVLVASSLHFTSSGFRGILAGPLP